MSGKFAADHADALATVQEDGVAVGFMGEEPGALNEGTGEFGPSVLTTMPGFAIRKQGDPEQYQALELDPNDSPTLFWVPTTYGDTPKLGMRCLFSGGSYSVRSVEPLAPDGVTIAANVIIAR